jgi:transcriptional regulator with XRE-family HTH domain
MSYAVVAKRSRVSMPTVVRTLRGRNLQVSLGNLVAIAKSLGMRFRLDPEIRVDDLLEHQAQEKARRLVGMVQATSGLESQAVDDEAMSRMTRQTAHELLAGSPRRLWAD